jgi:hypothetical protein
VARAARRLEILGGQRIYAAREARGLEIPEGQSSPVARALKRPEKKIAGVANTC